MFVIMVYDINVDRVVKVLKIGRKYLNWVQNSVLEGDLTKAKIEKMKSELRKIIKPKEDSIIFYILRSTKYMNCEHLGKEKGKEELIL
jgi:CRISPR-associated protein Cas2